MVQRWPHSDEKPNIFVLMGDAIGWGNLGSYDWGLMLEVNRFEPMNWPAQGCSEGSIAHWVVFKHEMWWFQNRTQVIAKYVPSLVEYPSMQAGFSFNIGGLKERVEQAIAASKGQAD